MKTGPPDPRELHELAGWLNVLRLDMWPDEATRERALAHMRSLRNMWASEKEAAVQRVRDLQRRGPPKRARKK